MKLLLDTHTFLWYISADPRLPTNHRIAIQDPSNDVFLSVGSIWEAVIKYELGKLPLPAPPSDYLPLQREAHGITALPIDENAMVHLANLPPIHRDPFDRILIAQANQYGFSAVTIDPLVLAYPVAFLPAI